jgi:hypothetical protein
VLVVRHVRHSGHVVITIDKEFFEIEVTNVEAIARGGFGGRADSVLLLKKLSTRQFTIRRVIDRAKIKSSINSEELVRLDS